MRLFGLFAAALAAFVLFLASPEPASAQQRFSRIVVDVSPMRARGPGPFGIGHYGLFADRAQQVMAQEAAKVFAGSIDPRDRSAPILVIRIDAIQFGDAWGGDSDHRAALRVTDYMEGAGLVVSGGKVIRQVPMLGAYDNTVGPSLMFADNAGPRLQGLSAFWAGWLKRKMGT